MKFITVYEPERMSIRVYLQLTEEPDEQGVHLFRSGLNRDLYNTPDVVPVRPGEEPPLYLRVEEGLARALANAIAPRPEFGERHLEDALTVRDRLLTLLEAEHSERFGEARAGTHIQDEAELRRERERRAR